MDIVKFDDEGGEEILRKVCDPVGDDEDVSELVETLWATMRSTKTGVGLASPQIGVHKRVFIMDTGRETGVFINPEIISTKGDYKYDEGCLSFPNKIIKKDRNKQVRLKFRDLQGNTHKRLFKKMEAVVVQHEIEHLDGILFIDN